MTNPVRVLSVEAMVRGLVRAAELKEQDEQGPLWDDECRVALDAARARGWGCGKTGSLKPDTERFASVSFVEKVNILGGGERTRHILCVWNKRYGGWTLPGGLAEEGESPEAAQRRELREETSLSTVSSELIYQAEFRSNISRANHVYVFRVTPDGVPVEMEVGCPVTWFSYEELLKWSPFAQFYVPLFAKL